MRIYVFQASSSTFQFSIQNGILLTKPIRAHLFSTLGLIFASLTIPSRLQFIQRRAPQICSLHSLSRHLHSLYPCDVTRHSSLFVHLFSGWTDSFTFAFLAFRTRARTHSVPNIVFVSDLIGWVCAAPSSLPLPSFSNTVIRTLYDLMIARTSTGKFHLPQFYPVVTPAYIPWWCCCPPILSHIPPLEFQHSHSSSQPSFTPAKPVVLLLLMLWLLGKAQRSSCCVQ